MGLIGDDMRQRLGTDIASHAVANPVGGGKDRLLCGRAVLIVAKAHQGSTIVFALDHKLCRLWSLLSRSCCGSQTAVLAWSHRSASRRATPHRRSGAVPPWPGPGGRTEPRALVAVPTGGGGSAAARARAGVLGKSRRLLLAYGRGWLRDTTKRLVEDGQAVIGQHHVAAGEADAFTELAMSASVRAENTGETAARRLRLVQSL